MKWVRDNYYAMEGTPEGTYFYQTKAELPAQDLRQKGDALVHLRYYHGRDQEPVPSYVEFFSMAQQQTIADVYANRWKFGWADVIDSTAVDSLNQRHIFVNNTITHFQRQDIFNRNGNLIHGVIPQLGEEIHYNPVTWDEEYAVSSDSTQGGTFNINGELVNNVIRLYSVDREGEGPNKDGRFEVNVLSDDGKQVIGKELITGVKKEIIDTSHLIPGVVNMVPIKVQIFDLDGRSVSEQRALIRFDARPASTKAASSTGSGPVSVNIPPPSDLRLTPPANPVINAL